MTGLIGGVNWSGRKSGPWRLASPLMLGASALALMAAGTPALAQQTSPVARAGQAEGVVAFSIPPQPLANAVTAFGLQSGYQVSVDQGTLVGAQSPGVSGSLTPIAALQRLLAGTGVTWRLVDTRSVALEKAPQSAAGTINLGPVRVEGTSEEQAQGFPTPWTDRAATDRSHSYAARAATVAGKTAQSLQEIPQSVSVLTRQQLDDRNLVSLEDALRQMPGVTSVPYSQDAGYFQIRGFQPEIQYDGVSVTDGASYKAHYDMSIYDRVEVLRGPSGVLQGNGEPAGTINLVRKRPHDTFGWSGSLMGGRWNNFYGNIDVTGPLTSSGAVRGRIVASSLDRDFFYDESHSKQWTLYGILEFDLDKDTILSLSGTLQERKTSPFDYGQSVYVNGNFLDAPRSAFFGVDWARSAPKGQEAYASLDHNFGGDWTSRVSINYRHSTTSSKYGYMDEPVNLDNSADYSIRSQDTASKFVSADAYLSGPFNLLGRKHELTIGANYSWFSYVNELHFIFADIPNIYDITYPEPASLPLRLRSDTRKEQYGAYAQARFEITDTLKLALGGRYSSYRSKIRRGQPFGAFSDYPSVDGHFTPSVGLVYNATKQLTLYGSYVSIFVPQTNITVAGDPLKPRAGEQFEVGAKGSLFNGAVNSSFALFNLTDRNRALTDPANPDYFLSAGKVRSRGVEVEISGEPLPGWSLSASYTYLQTKFLKDNPANLGKVFDLEEPRNTLKLWSLYRIGELAEPGFQVGGGVRFMSTTSRGGPVQPAYAVVDAQIGYRLDQQWSATLGITNLLDKKYYARVPASFFGFYGEPRSFTVTLRKGF